MVPKRHPNHGNGYKILILMHIPQRGETRVVLYWKMETIKNHIRRDVNMEGEGREWVWGRWGVSLCEREFNRNWNGFGGVINELFIEDLFICVHCAPSICQMVLAPRILCVFFINGHLSAYPRCVNITLQFWLFLAQRIERKG